MQLQPPKSLLNRKFKKSQNVIEKVNNSLNACQNKLKQKESHENKHKHIPEKVEYEIKIDKLYYVV